MAIKRAGSSKFFDVLRHVTHVIVMRFRFRNEILHNLIVF